MSTSRKLFICIALVAGLATLGLGLAVGIAVYRETNRPTYYEHAATFDIAAIPPGASDIRSTKSIPFSPQGLCFQFHCTEVEYRMWVSQERLKNPKLSDVVAVDARGFRSNQEPSMQPRIEKDGTLTLEPLRYYLLSSWKKDDSGLYLVFDITEQRAIRWSHSR